MKSTRTSSKQAWRFMALISASTIWVWYFIVTNTDILLPSKAGVASALTQLFMPVEFYFFLLILQIKEFTIVKILWIQNKTNCWHDASNVLSCHAAQFFWMHCVSRQNFCHKGNLEWCLRQNVELRSTHWWFNLPMPTRRVGLQSSTTY